MVLFSNINSKSEWKIKMNKFLKILYIYIKSGNIIVFEQFFFFVSKYA